MKAENYMTREVAAAQSSEAVSHLRNLMLRKGIGRAIIVEKGKPIGIVTKKDISKKLASESAPWRRRPIDTISVKRIMSGNLITIQSNASIKKVAELMMKKEISSLPVLEKGQLAGIITKMDMLRAYVEKYPKAFKTSELMSKNVVTANRFHTITHIVDLMEEKKVGRVVVVEGAKPIGIVTYSDISFVNMAEPKREAKNREVVYVRNPFSGGRSRCRYIKTFPLTAEDLMTSELITIKSRTDAAAAARILLENDLSALPVVDDDALVGIITKTDIVRGIAQATE